MTSLIYLILKILFFSSLLPLFFLILKFLVFGLREFRKNLTYNLFVLIIPIILFYSLTQTKKNKNKTANEIEWKKSVINIDKVATVILEILEIDKEKKRKKTELSLLNPNYKFTKEIISQNKLQQEKINLEKSIEKKVKKNESITSILKPFNITNQKIFELDNYLKKNNIFNFNKIRPGDKYSLLFSKKDNDKLIYFSYELNRGSYLIINFDTLSECKIKERPFQIKKHKLSGVINSHLWQAVNDVVESSLETEAVVSVIADKIYPWTIRFTHLNPNDKFKIIYEAKYINNEFVKIENVYAAVFVHKGENYYAIPFKEDSEKKYTEYFDEKGNNLRNFFLQAPVDFRRISSKYSKSRRHPVTGRVTAHKGTDFAAERGSPIFSTADGIVTAAQYKKHNGYYVKIRHNNTYETQYLHMQKKSVNYWKKNGIKPGKKIKQGQIIGYVGATGLATGPHVCYRFWKNGKQVDPFKQNLPPSEPIKERHRTDFNLKKNKWIKELEEIKYPHEDFLNLDA
tara:strand:- start:524 stop:2065 length:1542 start_codon:yes stop_codon:yes gene_type:complete